MCLIVDKVPTGNSYEDKSERRRIIKQVYENFYATHPYHCVYNYNLKSFIYVNKTSVRETIYHAAVSYLSTLAVIQIDTVLRLARKVSETSIKPTTANQQRFEKMLIMEYALEGIGNIKLTVGVLKRQRGYLQYCITAIETKIP